MNSILIYTIGKKLCFHSGRVVKNGTLEVFDFGGNVHLTIPVIDQEYKSVTLEVEPGMYRVRFVDDVEIVEKQTFIGT